MKRILLGGVGLLALGLGATPAAAADIPVKVKAPPPVALYNWSGFYGGADIGYAWGKVDWVYHDTTGVLADRPIASNPASVDGGFGSVHIGYLHQWGNWVVGAEFSYAYADDEIKGNSLCFNQAFQCNMHLRQWFTVGPRLGYAWDNWLLYATGGYANGEIRTDENAVGGGPIINAGGAWHGGWFAGGGIEYGINQFVVVGIEYKHLDFNTVLQTSLPFSNVETRNVSGTFDVVAARLTIRFGALDPWK